MTVQYPQVFTYHEVVTNLGSGFKMDFGAPLLKIRKSRL